MKSIINLFWGICLLRQSPAAVPGQGAFAALVVGANLLVSLLVSSTLTENASLMTTLTSIVVGQAVTASVVWVLLATRNLSARFNSAIAALFGCDLMITLCFGLVLPALSLLGASAATLASLLLLLWSVTVTGYILHRAAEVGLAIGIGLAFGTFILSVTVSQTSVGA